MSVREYPNIDPPVVTVTTTYTGASAPIVETQVTKVLEDSLSGIEGIDYITSISRQEQSQITIRFKLERDADAAAADVRDRAGRTRGRLPDEIDEPIIQKIEADAQPILYVAFYSDKHSALEITDYADRYVKDQLQTLSGVATVNLIGERAYSMRIWLDPERLAAYNLTPQDVENALRRQNVEVPAGRIESVQREFTVLSETDLKTPAAIREPRSQGRQGLSRAAVGCRPCRARARWTSGASSASTASRPSRSASSSRRPPTRSMCRTRLPRRCPDILASLPEGMQAESRPRQVDLHPRVGQERL